MKYLFYNIFIDDPDCVGYKRKTRRLLKSKIVEQLHQKEFSKDELLLINKLISRLGK